MKPEENHFNMLKISWEWNTGPSLKISEISEKKIFWIQNFVWLSELFVGLPIELKVARISQQQLPGNTIYVFSVIRAISVSMFWLLYWWKYTFFAYTQPHLSFMSLKCWSVGFEIGHSCGRPHWQFHTNAVLHLLLCQPILFARKLG